MYALQTNLLLFKDKMGNTGSSTHLLNDLSNNLTSQRRRTRKSRTGSSKEADDLENPSGAKESSEEYKDNDKAMVDPEGGKAASVQDQETSEHVYKKPHEISEPSLPTENIYATGGQNLF